ncbi:hypothetical protein HanRHA438_Chr03g0126411 [Helianthus annuus]|nr:hypothetical protein HanIR_Chr03g0125241 [Helianthus annuus]KAJ0936049.1 hypothetical protein HanRHA438_Chr03g0126411 [Helianthus annuus]
MIISPEKHVAGMGVAVEMYRNRSSTHRADLSHWISGTSNRNQATKSPIMAASRRLRDLRSWWRSEIPMKTCLHLLQLDKKGPTIWIVLNV